MTTVVVKETNNIVEVISRGIQGKPGPGGDISVSVLAESSGMSDQNPDGLDSPLKVIYSGSDVASPGGELIIRANGDIDILKDGTYNLSFFQNIGRDNNNGVAHIASWGDLNGEQFLPTVAFSFDNSSGRVTRQLIATLPLEAGDKIELFIARDGSGVDDGGLLPLSVSSTLAALGVGDIASATVVLSIPFIE